jgi:transcriptional regulator with XRE-family HTH domain
MSQAQTKPVVQFLERLQETGGLKGVDIANFAGVSKATVSRWASGQKSPHPRTQLIMSDLAYVVMRLSEYYAHEEVRAWLYARHPQLDGARAIDLIHDDRSEEVLAILDRLDADAYL